MKITVSQLKKLIREQVEEARRKPYAGAFSDEMMLASQGDEEGKFDNESWEKEWAKWVAKNKDQLMATALKNKDQLMAIVLEIGKERFLNKALKDPDFLPIGLNVKRLYPEFKA